jgi:hypothetical protein
MQTGEPDRLPPPARIPHPWRWTFGFLALAASVALVVWVARPRHDSIVGDHSVARVEPAAPDEEFVARLTGSKECQWIETGTIPLSSRLRKGQHVELVKGFAEITFDSGALVMLQGPASFDLNSAWAATLNRGRLKASVPPEAVGFSISNSTVEVVDLGTEFTMFTDSGGKATDVLVLKGEVEAAPRVTGDPQRIKLKEKEFRRFELSGVSQLENDDQGFDELTQPMELERSLAPIGYAHWTFNENDGGDFAPQIVRLPSNDSDLRVFPVSGSNAAHSKGRWQQALRFDGSVYAKAAFPGISKNAPHTVAFWVKVPKDASLSSAYAMVAWGADSKKFGSHPFHICWNRNANEGTVGVLRTDHSRGYALGSTPLRDGRWHHVAVVFIPRDDEASPMEVKQYVDGHLEGEGNPSPSGSDRFMSTSSESMSGTIWLGCRLGLNAVPKDRFFGEMDELVIADRALVPREIVRLMYSNQLDQ